MTVLLFTVLVIGSCQPLIIICGEHNDAVNARFITVNEKEYAAGDIHKGISEAFNDFLYYHGEDNESDYLEYNKNLVLNQDIEYELYSYPEMESVYIVITNRLHPLSTKENPVLYQFGIKVSEKGAGSGFTYKGYGPKEKTYIFYGVELLYNGNFTLRIDKINKPTHKKMSNEWIDNAKNAIEMYVEVSREVYMQDDAFKPGNYRIYVKGVNENDEDSVIIFEHESGLVYSGLYYLVHTLAPELISFDKVALVPSPTSEAFVKYLERVKSNPALSMEYFLHE
ncbi:MAG: hypothetical protein LBR85_02145 [Oscillospiraceae bacterium]|jgi:hypothetical protein|nr:hypothetical protein [Oscillospiraceae bacterium]